ncbi:YcjF family protein [Zavarzinella formosa]|uniref:YcjF family protein n=1 Tax=Zavarzinella formosa TaxID=360055 RepID=UPI0002EB7BF3|nr:DUF697 domain-containing protein [Zavarzinella formosa]
MYPSWANLANLFAGRDQKFQAGIADARHRANMPVFWMLGRTQTGKTSVIHYLTGAPEAEIGNGFRPCTRYSREYPFPNPEAPLLNFLDTRGIDEPGYDPAEDLAQFNDKAHVIVVTVKALDHAQENLVRNLDTIRRAKPGRPVLLLLTCLHEAYPQKQHPTPYPFGSSLYPPNISVDLTRSIALQQDRFKTLVDDIIPIDLTKPEEGFAEPNYGGDALKQSILDHLPKAIRQTMLTLDAVTSEFRDESLRRAMPVIVSYSTLAAGAGAIPVPFIDMFLLPGIQAKMIADLATVYGQPLSAERFWEIASSLGAGVLARQAAREAIKIIPGVGSAAGAALAFGMTFALGRAFCIYYRAVCQGHVPDTGTLKRIFEEELGKASRFWKPGG